MIHHHLTKYEESGIKYAEAWLQINLFGHVITFGNKKMPLTKEKEHPIQINGKGYSEILVTKKDTDELVASITTNVIENKEYLVTLVD